ncbi:MAG: hypothetical protein K2J60_12965 [Acetatifactor sp.]|nr:hypothetical protein [Acetatifactor sp.]
MRKKIVIVDDRPWKMQDCIQKLQKEGIIFCKTIYYPNNTIVRKEQQELMEEYKQSTGIEVVQVNDQSEFLVKMDELYVDPNIIFLMDYDLKGDMNRNDFFARINVKYAIAKDQNEKKIWFYTSGPNDIRGLLRETFHDNVISVPVYSEGKLEWDEDQVKAAVEG